MSQYSQILTHLKKHGSIDPMKALHRYGCYRLAARIQEMRQRGQNIETVMIKFGEGRQHAEYRWRGEKSLTGQLNGE